MEIENKTRTVLQVNVNERIYSLECSPESPLGELHDVLSSMKSFIVSKINESNQCKEEKAAE